ncbi:uncharacterized protein A4U43_C01F11390 [Asparagus officinalis]|uniref:Uncharacterized protein n=1 Tax=Asparagus officinalis TaxID=4686 RepID=A0A5P1FPC6_ASPOF|nr:proline-rich receptor-like protein kinase PERK2 [Asparagus officinalis]ONK79884.1 uncharacterized protein A4U43_C01F11390 [Asparagus officinalis]
MAGSRLPSFPSLSRHPAFRKLILPIPTLLAKEIYPAFPWSSSLLLPLRLLLAPPLLAHLKPRPKNSPLPKTCTTLLFPPPPPSLPSPLLILPLPSQPLLPSPPADLLLSSSGRAPPPSPSPPHPLQAASPALSSHPSSLPPPSSLLRSYHLPSLRSFNILISAFARSVAMPAPSSTPSPRPPNLAPDAETLVDRPTGATTGTALQCRRRGSLLYPREGLGIQLVENKAKGCEPPDAGHTTTLVPV